MARSQPSGGPRCGLAERTGASRPPPGRGSVSPHPAAGTPEWRRLQEVPRGRAPWRHWGPYLSERAWGTVREDYSADGDAWGFFPFDHARSRAYRWNEDGLAGVCDDRQTLCLAFALWNGRDPFLKERIFGLTGTGQPRRGRQGVLVVPRLDAHPLVDALALHVPAGRFPYERADRGERAAGPADPEYELVDTGMFDEAVLRVTADYAKAGPEDILIERLGAQPGPEPAPSTCSPRSGSATPGRGRRPHGPRSASRAGSLRAAPRPRPPPARRPAPARRAALLRQRDQRAPPLGWRRRRRVPQGRHQRPRRRRRARPSTRGSGARRRRSGTGRASPRASGDRCGCASTAPPRRATRRGLRRVMQAAPPRGRRILRRADPAGRSADEAAGACARPSPACCGASSSTITTSSAGWTATRPPAPAGRAPEGRNHDWPHLDNRDVISMPDKWEYPWYAAWDLAFHCVTLAHVDPAFAKSQLDPDLPRVVHAPERAAPRLRVGPLATSIRRCTPGRRCASTRSRRDERLRLPRARVPQADHQLHLVGEPQGRRGPQRLLRAGSWGWTTSASSTAPRRCPPAACSSSRTAPPGWRCTAWVCWRSRSTLAPRRQPTRTSPPSSSSTSP